MSRLLFFAAFLAVVVGCNRPASPPRETGDSRIRINAPGVDVDVKDKGGVNANVPGADVNVNPK